MLRGGLHARARHGAHGEGNANLSAEHVAELGGLVEQRIQADAQEVDEHELRDRAQARGRRPHRGAEQSRLRNGGIEHALAAEFGDDPLGDAHYAAHFFEAFAELAAARHVLAHQDHVRVGAHGDTDRLVDRR